MPEYKRKRRSRFSSAPKINKKRLKKEKISRDIEMTPSESSQNPQKTMRVVKGRKPKLQMRSRTIMLVTVIVALAVVICHFAMPSGIIETVSNSVSVIGSGSYPLELSSNETLNVVSKGAYYYVLTNSKISAYSNGGKEIFSHVHGFENPVLKTSKTRALVFDQGGKQLLIFNLGGLKSTVESKQQIKTASIGDDGTYATVISADNYAAAVNVYKKNNNLVYEWYSSTDLVNNVAIAPTGKKIAISTFSSNVGQYNSKVSVFNFKSATAENEKTYENTIVYAMDTTFAGGFSVITSNQYNFIKWSNFKISEYKNEYNTAMFRVGNNGVAVVYNRASDKTDNRIAIFAKNGKLKQELEFKGIITDFALKNSNIYCVSDTKAYVLNKKGKVLRSNDCGFGVSRLTPLGQNTLAVITDNAIDKIKLEQE